MAGKRLVTLAATCLVLVFAVTEAFAISITGAINFVSPPPASVEVGGTPSDTHITFFTERNNFALTSDLSVDIISAGTYAPTGTPPAPSNSGLTPGVITTGTIVDSFFLSLNPATINAQLTGSITFESNILGIIVSNPSLSGSDGLLGAIGTTYPTGLARQTLDSSFDSVILSSDFRTLTVNMAVVSGNLDQVRVITAPVPEPSTMLLLGSGLVGLIGFGRKKGRTNG